MGPSPMVTPNPDWDTVQTALQMPTTVLVVHSNPLARALETRIVSAQPDHIVLAFAPTGDFVQGAGVLQGGAVTTMLDFAMAFAALSGLPQAQPCATVTLAVSFLRAARRGPYRAAGQVVRRGRRLVFAEARLFHAEDDSLVATATSSLAI